jgi:hypothetical protein
MTRTSMQLLPMPQMKLRISKCLEHGFGHHTSEPFSLYCLDYHSSSLQSPREFVSECNRPTDTLRLARIALMARRLDCVCWQYSLVPKLIKYCIEPRQQMQPSGDTLQEDYQLVLSTNLYISDCSLRFLPYLIDVTMLYNQPKARFKIEDQWALRLTFQDDLHMVALKYAQERNLKRLTCLIYYQYVIRPPNLVHTEQSHPVLAPREPLDSPGIPGHMVQITRGMEAIRMFWDWIVATMPSIFQSCPHDACNAFDHRKRCVPAWTRYWISHVDAMQRADERKLLEQLGEKTSQARLRACGPVFDVKMRLMKISTTLTSYVIEEERNWEREYHMRKDRALKEIEQGCSHERRKQLLDSLKVRWVKGVRKECWHRGLYLITEQFKLIHEEGGRLEMFFLKDLAFTRDVFGGVERARSAQPARYRLVKPGETVNSLMQL